MNGTYQLGCVLASLYGRVQVPNAARSSAVRDEVEVEGRDRTHGHVSQHAFRKAQALTAIEVRSHALLP